MDNDATIPSLDDVVAAGAQAGATPAQQAQAALAWRDDARGAAVKAGVTADPHAFFEGSRQMDEDVTKTQAGLQGKDLSNWATKTFPDQAAFSNFKTAYEEDPESAKLTLPPDAAKEMDSILQNPAYVSPLTQNRYDPLIAASGKQVGAYKLQRGVGGQADVLVNVDDPSGKGIAASVLHVPLVNDDMVKQARDKALADQKQAEAYATPSPAGFFSDPEVARSEAMARPGFDTQAREAALRVQQLSGPDAKSFLQSETVQNAFKASPLGQKFEEWHSGEDIARGFMSMKLGGEYAIQTLSGNPRAEETKSAIAALPDVLPGTSKHEWYAQGTRNVLELAGQLPLLSIPDVGPTVLAASAYGNTLANAGIQADAADEQAARLDKDNPALAQEFRDMATQMRDTGSLGAVAQAAIFLTAGKLLPKADTFLGNGGRSSLEWGGITAAQQQVDQALNGKPPDPMDVLWAGIGGAAMGALHGAGAKGVEALKNLRKPAGETPPAQPALPDESISRPTDQSGGTQGEPAQPEAQPPADAPVQNQDNAPPAAEVPAQQAGGDGGVAPTEPAPAEPSPAPAESQPAPPESGTQGAGDQTGGNSSAASTAKPAPSKPPINPDEEIRLAHADEAARAVANGQLPIQNVPQGTKEVWNEQAKKRVAAGEGKGLVASLNEKPRVITPVEHLMLMHYADNLESESDKAAVKIADPATPEAERQAASQVKDFADAERERLAVAGNRAGSAAGAALGVRALSLKRDEIPKFPQMVADAMKAKDPSYQTPLTPEERNVIEERHAKIIAADEAAKTSDEQGNANRATTEHAALLAETQAELAKTKADLANALKKPQKGEQKPRFTKRVVDSIAPKADAALERLRSRGATLNMGIDPSSLPDYALVMAGYIAKGLDAAAEMVGKFGDAVKGHLAAIEAAARKILSDESKPTTPGEIKAQLKDAQSEDPSRTIGKHFANELAKAHIREALENDGDTSLETINDKVHQDLKEFVPDMTATEARDLRTGYGKRIFLSDDPVDVKLRDLNRQSQLLSSLELAEKKLAPLKSGPQRDKASADVRALQKQLNEAMARNGIDVRSSESQLAGRREGIKTRLTNEIEDLQRVIDGKQQNRPQLPPVEYDKELQDLQKHRDALKKIVDAMPENVEADEKAKNAAALKAAQDAEKEWNRRADQLDFSSRGNKTPERSAEVRAARDKAKEAKARYDDLKKAQRAHEPAAYFADISRRVDAANERIAELEKKLAAGDTSVDSQTQKPSHPLLDEANAKVKELNTKIEKMRQDADRPAREAAAAQKELADAQKRVTELEQKLATNDLSVDSREPKRVVPPALAAERAKIADLNKKLEKARRDAEKPAREMKAAAKELTDAKARVAELERKLAAGDLSIKAQPRRTVPAALAAERDKLKALNKEMAKARSAAKAKPDPEVQRRERFKVRMRKDIADLQVRRAAQNYGPRKKTPAQLKHDAESERLAAERRHELHGWEVEKERLRLEQRKGFEKGFDIATGVMRGGKLSRVLTLAKLVLFSAGKLISTPVGELLGGLYSGIPGMDRANIEGRFSLKALGKFYSGFFGQGMKDALQTLSPVANILSGGKIGDRLRRSDLKNQLAENSIQRESVHLEPHFWDIPQILHEALKSPLKRAGFEMAVQKLTEAGERAGEDTTSKEARAEIIRKAGQQAQRGILMADNVASDAINRGLARLEQPDKETGQVRPRGKALAYLGRSIFTFNKVAANHFVELMNTVLGVPLGLARAGYAETFGEGLKSMHVDDVNSIMRQLKAGTPGLAMIAMGATNPQMFGGLNHMQNRKKDEPGFGEIKVGDTIIPRVFSLASPWLLAAHIGATFTHIASSRLHKHDTEPQGAAAGAIAALGAVTETGPVINEGARLSKLFEPNKQREAVADFIRNQFEPGIISEIATYLDKDLNGKPVQRKAESWLDDFKLEIPVVRETLPEKTKKRNTYRP